VGSYRWLAIPRKDHIRALQACDLSTFLVEFVEHQVQSWTDRSFLVRFGFVSAALEFDQSRLRLPSVHFVPRKLQEIDSTQTAILGAHDHTLKPPRSRIEECNALLGIEHAFAGQVVFRFLEPTGCWNFLKNAVLGRLTARSWLERYLQVADLPYGPADMFPQKFIDGRAERGILDY
jgi:hypothetical protein